MAGARHLLTSKCLRHLLMAAVLGCFAVPAMAARDCWIVWETEGILRWADDALNPLHFECKDSPAEAVAPVQSIAEPVLASVTERYSSVYALSFTGCVSRGLWGSSPWMTCKYNYTATFHWNDGRVTSETGETSVNLQMPCGAALNTTPIGSSPATCKGIRTKTPPGPPSCPRFGNPIEPLTGIKRQHEPLLTWGRGHSLSLTYVSRPKPESNPIEDAGAQSFGRWWSVDVRQSHLELAVACDKDAVHVT